MSSHDGGRASLFPRAVSAAGLGLALAASVLAPAALADGASGADEASAVGSGLAARLQLAATVTEDAAQQAEVDGSGEAATPMAATVSPASSASTATSSSVTAQAPSFSYALDDQGGATVTGASVQAAEITVPASVDGHPVVAVGAGAFKDDAVLAKLVLPDSVTQVGDGAFAGCTSLAEVTLSSSLAYLGADAFKGCTALAWVEVPATLAACGTGWDGSAVTGPFAGCTALASVTFASGAKALAPYLLAGCPSVATVAIPASVTSVNTLVFDASEGYLARLTVVGERGSSAEQFATAYGATFKDASVPAAAVTLSQTDVSLFRGATAQLKATVQPTDATDVPTWSTSDASVVTVDANGLLKAVGAGQASVTVRAGGVSATCSVRVSVPVSSITLNRTAFKMEATQTRVLTADVAPVDAADKSVVWSSSNDKVAMVDSSGTVTAVGKGTATITCAAQDGSGVTSSLVITVVSDVHVVDSLADFASPHDYPNECRDFWKYTAPGAQALDVTFAPDTYVEETFDAIEIRNSVGSAGDVVGTYTGSELAGRTLRVLGDTVTVKMLTDDQVTAWGFAVTSVTPVVVDGWATNGGWTYYYSDGAPVLGENYVDGAWRYFDPSTGHMLTGLVYLPDGRVCYYDDNGCRVTGDVFLADGWHYFSPLTGDMYVGLCTMPDGTRRYYDSHGVRASGPVVIDGRTYYFNAFTGAQVVDVTYVDVDITNVTNVTVNNTTVNVTQIVVNENTGNDADAIDKDDGTLSDEDKDEEKKDEEGKADEGKDDGGAAAQPADQEAPAEPATPEQPATTEQPEQPSEPEQPATPEQPAESEAPAATEQPGEPETPAEPATPEQPAEPGQPGESETPATPEAPAATESEPPAEPEAPVEPTTPEEPASSDAPTETEQPAEPDPVVPITDRASRYQAYLDKLQSVVDAHGVHGVATAQDGSDYYTGLAVAKLVDFDGDGNDELLLAYRDDAASEASGGEDLFGVYATEVWGERDGALACLMNTQDAYHTGGGLLAVQLVTFQGRVYLVTSAADGVEDATFYTLRGGVLAQAATYREADPSTGTPTQVNGQDVADAAAISDPLVAAYVTGDAAAQVTRYNLNLANLGYLTEGDVQGIVDATFAVLRGDESARTLRATLLDGTQVEVGDARGTVGSLEGRAVRVTVADAAASWPWDGIVRVDSDGDTYVRLAATVDGAPAEVAWYGGAEFFECANGYQVLPLPEAGMFAVAVGAGVVEPLAWEVVWDGTYADLQQAVAGAEQAATEQAVVQPIDAAEAADGADVPGAETVEQQPADAGTQPQVEEVATDDAAYADGDAPTIEGSYDTVG